MENQFEISRAFWGNEILKGNLIYPNTEIIRFVKRNFKNTDIMILDYGCGGGRNTIALLNEGYKVIAMDYTDEAVLLTQKKLDSIGVTEYKVIKNDGFTISLPEGSIDAVIADGSLFYNSIDDTAKIVSELQKVLKMGGLMWADFRTKKDSLYGRGKQIDDGLFVLEDGTGREGCSYLFVDESDIRNIFTKARMEIVSLDDYTYSEDNRRKLNSWFHVVAKK